MNRALPLTLTARERECLRLVGNGLSSKEIAAQLGLTPGTIDQYLKDAIRKLGAPTRRSAARQLAALEEGDESALQKLELQSPGLAGGTAIAFQVAEKRTETSPRWRVPFLRQGRQYNALSPLQRLMWIGGLSVIMLVAVANFLNGLGVLFRITD